jgi:hypothetical protein
MVFPVIVFTPALEIMPRITVEVEAVDGTYALLKFEIVLLEISNVVAAALFIIPETT